MALRDLLMDLRDGRPITISRYRDVAERSLEFVDGEWRMTAINCYNSADLGLGTCRCQSHDPCYTDGIDRKTALYYLRELIAAQEADNAARQAEIAWLDNAIILIDA